MTIQGLKVGQICKEGNNECEVAFVYNDRFEVQYISGACFTYRQADLDNGTIEVVRF